MTDFRKLVAAEIERQCRTRAEVAASARMTPAKLSDWLNGVKPNINVETLERLLDALGIRVVVSKRKRPQARARSRGRRMAREDGPPSR